MGSNCKRDVLIYEFNHVIGMHKEVSDRGSVKKPADSMAEFVTQLTGDPTDCGAGSC